MLKGAKTPYIANHLEQSNNTTVRNGLYGFQELTAEEYGVIHSVITTALSGKYPKKYESLGLLNEAYGISYKPRYILLDIVIELYTNSLRACDLLAVATALSLKGAAYRLEALDKYSILFSKITKQQLATIGTYFVWTRPIFVYDTVSKLYEAEHDLEKALVYAKLAERQNTDRLSYYPVHIAQILLKLEPDKSIKYLRGVLWGLKYYKSKEQIKNEYKTALTKKEKGYRYKPRKLKHTKSEIDAEIRKCALTIIEEITKAKEGLNVSRDKMEYSKR